MQVAILDAERADKLLTGLLARDDHRRDGAFHVDRGDIAAFADRAPGMGLDEQDAVLGGMPYERLDRRLPFVRPAVDQGAQPAAVGRRFEPDPVRRLETLGRRPEDQSCSSTQRAIVAASMAPEIRAASLPSRNRTIVGIERMP